MVTKAKKRVIPPDVRAAWARLWPDLPDVHRSADDKAALANARAIRDEIDLRSTTNVPDTVSPGSGHMRPEKT